MDISASGGQTIYRRPVPDAPDIASKASEAPGQRARAAVAAAREAGSDRPANAQGAAVSAIAGRADPSSVFAAALAPPPPATETASVDATAPETGISGAAAAARAETGEAAVLEGRGTAAEASLEVRDALESTARSGAESAAEIDRRRTDVQEEARAETLADFRADDAAADREAEASIAGAVSADETVDADADAGNPEAIAQREETERREALLAADTAARETERLADRGETGRAAEAGAVAPDAGGAAEAPEEPATAARSVASETATAARAAEPSAPSSADSTRGGYDALANAAEAAYAEALAGRLAQSQGDVTDRVL